ncbi:hypothetical protein RBU61_16495 [Tissierella sp. MB52-C2]|uniref:hypothetical protein n=1 Tax=Tissierella sp. MB52-C2 TaxID=3070999 RepID=UPI00280AD120|nr:hypothetical protein [Tissierella sp. MB52-C2]WMM24510.1 hypothetical protein RBU61_16495 [Tissierella sp. MB52-C2]
MTNKKTIATQGTPWWVKGDLNGFFGLFTNSLTNFLAAIGLLVFAINMPKEIVYGRIVPAAAISIGIGNIWLAYQARKLSLKEQKGDVTAMPYGLSVPHYFVVAFAVILPVYLQTKDWHLAWSVALAWNVVQGVIMTIGAFVGPYIRKYIPRSAMLGSLAGLAVTYIAMNPMGEIFSTPYIGLTTLAIVVVGWLANKKMPGNIPAGLVAIIAGSVLAWSTGYMDIDAVKEAASGFAIAFPKLAIGDLAQGFAYLSPFLAAAIPLAIYDFLESLDNVESAEVAGDHYNTTKALLIPGLLTLLGAALGSPYPTIIYIGHPGWKATGARVGYGLLTGLVIIVVSFLGLLPLALTIIPLVALLPILVYISMVIGAQAFGSTEKKHIPALIIAFMPFIASYIVTQINNALGAAGTSIADVGAETLVNAGIPYIGWKILGAGDILSSMMIATIVIFAIDKKFKLSAVYSLITAALAFFGIIHASELGLGTGGYISLGYVAMTVVFLVMEYYKKEENISVEN